MAHFNHLALNSYRNGEMRASYQSAVVRGGKFGGMYASKNYMEYFAEASATYLLPPQLVPRPSGFPKGFKQLRLYSPETYKMCESFWKTKKPKIKPSGNFASRVDDIPKAPKVDDIPSPPRLSLETRANDPKEARMLREIKKLIEWGDHYDMVSKANGFYKQESFDAYFRAHGRIIMFERRFQNAKIESLKKRVKEKIGLVD